MGLSPPLLIQMRSSVRLASSTERGERTAGSGRTERERERPAKQHHDSTEHIRRYCDRRRNIRYVQFKGKLPNNLLQLVNRLLGILQ